MFELSYFKAAKSSPSAIMPQGLTLIGGGGLLEMYWMRFIKIMDDNWKFPPIYKKLVDFYQLGLSEQTMHTLHQNEDIFKNLKKKKKKKKKKKII